MREIIISYNANALEYAVGQEPIDVFTSDPKPEHAMYVPERFYGVELGTIIAMYETDDPASLVETLRDSPYGAAIRYVEESHEKHALGSNDDVGRVDAQSEGEEDPKSVDG